MKDKTKSKITGSYLIIIGMLAVDFIIAASTVTLVIVDISRYQTYPLVSLGNIYKEMLSVVCSILGIAVTTWVGLNIFNILEKKDLQVLKNRIEVLSVESQKQQEKSIESIRKMENERTKQAEQSLESILDNDREWNLLFIKEDRLSQVIKNEEISYYYSFEQVFDRIVKSYERKDWDLLETLSTKFILCLATLQTYNPIDPALITYLTIRESRFLLIQAIAARERSSWKEFKSYALSSVERLEEQEDTVIGHFEKSALSKRFKGQYYQEIAHIYMHLNGHILNTEYTKENEWIDKADEYSQKAIETNLDTSEIHRIRGMVYERQKNHKEAKKEFNMAVSKDPTSPKAAYKQRKFELEKHAAAIIDNKSSRKPFNIHKHTEPERDKLRIELRKTIAKIKGDLIHYNNYPDFSNLLVWAYTCMVVLETDEGNRTEFLEMAIEEQKYSKNVNRFNSKVNCDRIKYVRQHFQL